MVNEKRTTMSVRIAAVALGVVAAVPAAAGELKYDEAKRLVAGKLFSYACFDGTTGAGRIQADGSVHGTIRVQGVGPLRFVSFPAGTLHNRGGAICANVKGMPLSPCFRFSQTSAHTFRGAIMGFGFAYCDFIGRGGRMELARAGAHHRPAREATAAPTTYNRD
jgi:hypothetical protein